MELLTAAEMRAVEQAAIGSGAVTGLELMERAGRGVVEAMLDWRPALARAPGRAIVLCGPGNNGGDGFVIARLLKERGWEIDLRLLGEIGRLPPDAAANAARWRAMGDIAPLGAPAPGLVVDALFGTGLARPLEGAAAEWAEAAAGPVVTVDAPSGLCMDSGRPLGPAFRAALTISFHREKLGHRLAEGPERCGALRVVDIGLPAGGAAARLGGPDAARLAKGGAGHKYGHGHALVLAGGPGKGGAARLAARGALRIGAGLVTVGAPAAAIAENAARLDAIMLREIGDAAALSAALEDARLNAVVLGPGLGAGAETRAMAEAALGSGRRVALDADALTAFASAPEALFALTNGREAVLTPHMGEFGRLFPDLREKLEAPAKRGPAYSKVDAAREAAARAGCTLLLKGADTVVADPRRGVAVVSAERERACPWLATAGAGDVLAGFIGGLLARSFTPGAAAETGAWLHQEAARAFGPGLIAEDLPEALPGVLRALGA